MMPTSTGKTLLITADELYWSQVEQLGILDRHTKQEVFDKCDIIIRTSAGYSRLQSTLKQCHASIKSLGKKGFDKIKWHLHIDYNEAFLLSKGFSYCNRSTIEAVEDGKGRYDIISIFWNEPSVDGLAMLALGDYDFNSKKVTHRPCKDAAGESRVKERGDKTMSGEMYAYGSWDAFGNTQQGLGKGKKEVRVYNPNAKVDSYLNSLLASHVDTLTAAEREIAPSCAEARRLIADKYDPSKRHRITMECTAFSCTISVNYVTDPHDDSGARGVLEFIQFVNAKGPLPPGHKWLFVVGGCIYELPNVKGESCIIALPACGVYHGTLPTSSTGDTYEHGNYGSALITKADVLKGLQRHNSLATLPSDRYSSSTLYFGTAPKPALPPPQQTRTALPVSRTPTVAHAFWGKATGCTAALPSYALLGLESAVAKFDTVYLWQYDDVPNAPAGAVKRNAANLLSAVERDALLAKHVTIAHVSDVVRFRAAALEGGWVIDADNLWLCAPPTGFVFSTRWAKRTGGVAPSSAKWQAMAKAFAKDGWDGGDSINTPFSVLPKTAFAADLLSLVDAFVTRQAHGSPWSQPPSTSQWNFFMWGVRDLIVKHGLGVHVRPPIEYGVSPYWHGFTDTILRDGFFDQPSTQRLKFGVQLPSTTEIFSEVVCVPSSFVLADRNGKYAGLDVHAYAKAHPKSLLGRLVGYVSSSVGTKRKSAGMMLAAPKKQKMAKPLSSRRGIVHPFLYQQVSVYLPNGCVYTGTVDDHMPASLDKEAQLRVKFDQEVPGGRWCPESCVF